MVDQIHVYIGIGSNLERPLDQVNTALTALKSLAVEGAVVASSLYRTKPVGPGDQPYYINAVAGFLTVLLPYDLLSALLTMEKLQGRIRQGEQWGPRTLDLDLLLYGDIFINDENLQVPHPRIKDRMFVLAPLADIAPELLISGQGMVKDLLARHDRSGVEKIYANS